MRVIIKAFKAMDDPESTQKYLNGHAEVLRVMGITKVTSADVSWCEVPDNYIISVESTDNARALGGGRLQVFTDKQRLPIEAAVYEKDPKIVPIIERFKYHDTAEFCGLWNSKEIAGYGIGSIFLGRVGVAMAHMLNLRSLFALCSPATLNNCLKVGFEVVTSLGKDGLFYYPTERLVATALIISNLEELPWADISDRERIINLRENPVQIAMEIGPKGEMEIEYDLNIQQVKRVYSV
jgi:hypothetical protein